MDDVAVPTPRPDLELTKATVVDQLRRLFARHCECRPLDVERDSHSHDCDTDITDACREAIAAFNRNPAARAAPLVVELAVQRLRTHARALVFWGYGNPPAVPPHVAMANVLNDLADELAGLPRRRPSLFVDVDVEASALTERIYRLEEILARMIDEYRHRWGAVAVEWAITKLNKLREDGRGEPFHPTMAWEPTPREIDRIRSRLGVTEEQARAAYALGARCAPGEPPAPRSGENGSQSSTEKDRNGKE